MNDYLGLTAAAADFNGDGHMDLVTSTPYANSADNTRYDIGRMHLFWGSP